MHLTNNFAGFSTYRHTFLSFLYILIFGLSGALIGCKSPTTTQPKAPAEAYQHTNMEIQSEKHKSVVHVPVELSIAEVTKHLNAQVQGVIYEDNSFNDDNQDN